MKNKKAIIARVVLVLAVIAAMATNPSKKDFDNYCRRKSQDMSTPLGRFQYEAIDRDNYLLFSIHRAKVTYSGFIENEKVTTYIGIFNSFEGVSEFDDE